MTSLSAARDGLLSNVVALVDEAARVTVGSPLSSDVAGVRERLGRPLRVAIAGRTKAGKSTLLNALVGERLAATDATECTRIVTWYRYDLGYSVTARLRTGEVRNLEFERDDGELQIHLAGLAIAEIERLEVGWPSSRLANLTLIDTPGLDSGTAATSQRTVDALVGDDADAGEADAVLYLMRHMHRRDADFLEAFDRPVAAASPVNAVALLSRADEVGGGHDAALTSARAIARRYAGDPRIADLVLTVLPLSGLLAETGASLREDEVAWLRELALLDGATRETLLLSVDRFRKRPENPLAPEAREALLRRFGLFSLRFAVTALIERPDLSSPDLARKLIDLSGIRDLESLLQRQFTERADALKARSALTVLRRIAKAARRQSLTGVNDLVAGIERVEASSHELAELRALHLVRTGVVSLDTEAQEEVGRVLASSSLAERLGQPIGTGPQALAAAALLAIDRWRTKTGDPMADRALVETSETIARTYEGIYDQLNRIPGRGRVPG